MKTVLLVVLWALPILATAVLRFGPASVSTRRRALVVATPVLLLGILLFISTEAPLLAGMPGLAAVAVPTLAVDGLSAVLVPLVALIAVSFLVGSTRLDLDENTTTRTLFVLGSLLGVLVSRNLVVATIFWVLSLAPTLLDGRTSTHPALRRASTLLMLCSALPMVLSVAAVAGWQMSIDQPVNFHLPTLVESGVLAGAPVWIGALFVAGTLARLGIVPLHGWIPVLFERGALPIVVLTLVSPMGSFTLVRLGFSLFPSTLADLRPVLLALGAISAVYGSLLALGQHNARRQLGFLWISICGFLLSGLASAGVEGVAGALFHDVAVSLAMTGLLLIVRAIEVRTGTADMRRLGGLVSRTPAMATAYLLLGLAAIGFPGTATFVSEDLLVQGLLHDHSITTGLLLLASALNGVSLVRSFKRIFLGPPAAHGPELGHVVDLLPRERAVAVVLVVVLLAGGAIPAPLLAIREGVAVPASMPSHDLPRLPNEHL